MSFLITIFTPTFNRGQLLKRVWSSLEKQKFKNFEWVIVDDGSSDDTREVVKKLINEATFEIVYRYQENGGKHRAINRGVGIARGELFMILDSDDYLTDDALERLVKKWNSVKGNSKCMGVSGNRIYHDGQIVGSKIPDRDLLCSFLDFRYRHHLNGDRGEAFRLSVFKEFPFPDFLNEKFCPESLIWNRMARKHEILYVDEDYVFCEYLQEGLSSNSIRLRRKSPTYATTIYRELFHADIPILYKGRAAINFWRFFLCAERKMIILLFQYFILVLFLPFGLFAFLRDSFFNDVSINIRKRK